MKRNYLILSDLHGTLPHIEYPGIFDAVLIAGDIAPDGKKQQQEDWMFGDFLSWTLSFKKVFYIAGNHDFWQNYPTSDNLVYLHDSFDEEFRIWGSPYCLPIWGNYQKTDDELEKIFANIPLHTDIIMSHTPPYGLLDGCESLFNPKCVEHVGSKSLLSTINRVQPKAVVCGHIHEHGCKNVLYGNTRVFNAAKKIIFALI
jgi:Icc-related predicted phosphoesterase